MLNIERRMTMRTLCLVVLMSLVVFPIIGSAQPVQVISLGSNQVSVDNCTERFRAVDRETPYLLPPSVQEWLPEQHLARFVVEVVSKLDLHELKMPYAGVGSEAFNPEMLLAMLFYG
jgi:hypothetical protein